jgi:hypothetical protein
MNADSGFLRFRRVDVVGAVAAGGGAFVGRVAEPVGDQRRDGLRVGRDERFFIWRRGERDGLQVLRRELQGVEKLAGAAALDVSGGDGAQQDGEADLDGVGVLEDGEVEGFEDLVVEILGRVAAVGVLGSAGLAEVLAARAVALVEVAEAVFAHGGGAAGTAVGPDMGALAEGHNSVFSHS